MAIASAAAAQEDSNPKAKGIYPTDTTDGFDFGRQNRRLKSALRD